MYDDESKQIVFIVYVRVICFKNLDFVFNRLICIKFSMILIYVIKINVIEFMQYYLIEIKINFNIKFIRVICINVWNVLKYSNLEISIGNGVGQNIGSFCC